MQQEHHVLSQLSPNGSAPICLKTDFIRSYIKKLSLLVERVENEDNLSISNQ